MLLFFLSDLDQLWYVVRRNAYTQVSVFITTRHSHMFVTCCEALSY